MYKRRSISLKQGLLLIVLAALLPISVAGIIQSIANWQNLQLSAMAQIHANTKAIAERERDAYIVSSRLLMVAAANPDIKNMTANCSNVLKTGFAGFEPIVNFLRTDRDGRARCSILPFEDGLSFVGENWWQRTKLAPALTMNQPSIGTVSKVPVIIMALPLRDENGAFAGSLSAGIEISKLAQSVAKAPESKTGSLAIIARNDELVASSGKAIPFDLPPDLRDGMSGIAADASGEKWMYHVEAIVGDELHVMYAEPRSRIMAAALSQFRTTILLPLIAIFLTLCAIWFGTNRLVVRWLSRLRNLSDEMTKGNFDGDRQAFAHAPAELRDLSDDLHDMADAISIRTSELTDALNAKTALTREIHHRVKNNLQIVTSLLTMQASRMVDAGAQAALKQARARIVALALIHRLTYEQDSESGPANVGVPNLLEELCKQLRYANRTNRNIQLSYDADYFAVDVDRAVPLALFVVEAITNSFRHAFPDNATGKIELTLLRIDEDAVVTVRDDGQGYDVANNPLGEMGFELMQGFASQLNGTVSFLSEVNSGSSTILRFKV